MKLQQGLNYCKERPHRLELEATFMYDEFVAQSTDTRDYKMGKRLEDVADTRRRIVEAAVELHGTVGPANTTMSAIADKAGVQRSTLYRHFPDDNAIFGACTSHWIARHPWPQIEQWRQFEDPTQRLLHGLTELYDYYSDNRQMLYNSMRDVEVMPEFVGEISREQHAATVSVLIEAFDRDDEDLRAAVSLAVDFRTWSSLADAGTSPEDAASLMARMVAPLAG